MIVPLSIWKLSHAVPDDVDLLPALPPLVRVALLCAHIRNLQIVSPPFRVFLFVLDTVSFNCPFTGSFPIHNTTSWVRSQDDYKLASTPKMGISAILCSDFCMSGQHLPSFVAVNDCTHEPWTRQK
jgi:hypothetical protein